MYCLRVLRKQHDQNVSFQIIDTSSYNYRLFKIELSLIMFNFLIMWKLKLLSDNINVSILTQRSMLQIIIERHDWKIINSQLGEKGHINQWQKQSWTAFSVQFQNNCTKCLTVDLNHKVKTIYFGKTEQEDQLFRLILY